MDHEKVLVESASELKEWLSENHSRKESVWLVRWKKSKHMPYLDYSDVVDELLCYGWVDSLPRNLDEEKTMLRISPRNPKSNWSGINKRKVSKLIEQGRMKEPGFRLIHLAKENGSWDFLNDVEQLIVPADLLQALQAEGKGLYFFDRFPPSSKRGILEWIKNAKQEKTRSKRILETARKAAQNIKANHPKGRDAGPKE